MAGMVCEVLASWRVRASAYYQLCELGHVTSFLGASVSPSVKWGQSCFLRSLCRLEEGCSQALRRAEIWEGRHERLPSMLSAVTHRARCQNGSAP